MSFYEFSIIFCSVFVLNDFLFRRFCLFLAVDIKHPLSTVWTMKLNDLGRWPTQFVFLFFYLLTV